VNYQIDHNLSATAKYQLNPNIRDRERLGAENLNSRNFRSSASGRTLIHGEAVQGVEHGVARHPSDARTIIHNEGYFGQSTLDLYDQLYLTGGAANDGSSTFGVQNRRAGSQGKPAWTSPKVTGEAAVADVRQAAGCLRRGGAGTAALSPSTNFLSNTIVSASRRAPAKRRRKLTCAWCRDDQRRDCTASRADQGTRDRVDIGLFPRQVGPSFTYYNAKTETSFC